MKYILDGVVILIVLGGLLLGYRHGFVRTIVKLVGCVVALVLAGTLSQVVAQGIFDQFMQEELETAIAEKVTITEGASLKEEIQNALEGLPGSVRNVLDNAGWVDRAIEEIDDTASYQPADISHSIVAYIVQPVVMALLNIIAFLVLFVLLMIVISLLAKLIGNLLHLPVLRQVDGILGAVLGTVEGVVMAMVVVAALQIAAASASDDAWLTRQDLENTVLVSFMAEHNPITDQWNVV